MRESGLSIRAIAAATGLNKETVNNVTRELTGNQTPEPITGTDGKTYTPKPRPIVDPAARCIARRATKNPAPAPR